MEWGNFIYLVIGFLFSSITIIVQNIISNKNKRKWMKTEKITKLEGKFYIFTDYATYLDMERIDCKYQWKLYNVSLKTKDNELIEGSHKRYFASKEKEYFYQEKYTQFKEEIIEYINCLGILFKKDISNIINEVLSIDKIAIDKVELDNLKVELKIEPLNEIYLELKSKQDELEEMISSKFVKIKKMLIELGIK